jgi:hypothetical protein
MVPLRLFLNGGVLSTFRYKNLSWRLINRVEVALMEAIFTKCKSRCGKMV